MLSSGSGAGRTSGWMLEVKCWSARLCSTLHAKTSFHDFTINCAYADLYNDIPAGYDSLRKRVIFDVGYSHEREERKKINFLSAFRYVKSCPTYEEVEDMLGICKGRFKEEVCRECSSPMPIAAARRRAGRSLPRSHRTAPARRRCPPSARGGHPRESSAAVAALLLTARDGAVDDTSVVAAISLLGM